MKAAKPFYKRHEREESELKEPKVVMSKQMFAELATLVKSQNDEIMLFGVVEKLQPQGFKIVEWLIPPQTDNTGAFVTTHDEEYPKWLMSLPREQRSKIRVHLHTHPKMATNPSGVDESTINEKVQDIDDFYLRMIVNHKLEVHLDIFDIENHLLYEERMIYVLDSIDDAIILTLSKSGIDYIFNHKCEEKIAELKTKIIPKKINTVQTTVKPYEENYMNEDQAREYYERLYGIGTYSNFEKQTTKKTKKKEETRELSKEEIDDIKVCLFAESSMHPTWNIETYRYRRKNDSTYELLRSIDKRDLDLPSNKSFDFMSLKTYLKIIDPDIEKLVEKMK